MRTTDTTLGRSMLALLPEWLGGRAHDITPLAGRSPASLSDSAAARHCSATDEQPTLAAIAETPQAGEGQSVVEDLLAQSRYALLLRPQLSQNLTPKQLARTRTALSEGMCLVPEGQVLIRPNTPAENEHVPSTSLYIEAYYLDRYPVTNEQYAHFVAGGGYEQMAIWDPEIWPALLDFVDSTGHPGPRFWKNGRYPRGEEHHPVVGLCWYESVAYSRWVGKRLPTDAEWIKAASWPVAIEGHPLLVRRYPWGEAMDRSRANLWGSGPARTASVYEFAGGVSVGGVQQMIGNVWEWTADGYTLPPVDNLPATQVQGRLKSIRGGAFDTYLDSQATCHFQSADVALSRKHNIGFRSAISLCDLVGGRDNAAADEDPSNEETQS